MAGEIPMRMGFVRGVGLFLLVGFWFSHCARYSHFRSGETFTYQYTRKGVEIGTEVFTLEAKGKHLVVKSDLTIGEGAHHQRGNSELILEENGNPVAYSRRLEVELPEVPDQSGLWELRYIFHGKTVTGEVTKDGLPHWEGTIENEKKDFYCIDNNALSLLAVLVKAIYPQLRGRAVYSVKAFHFSEARMRDVTLRKVRDGVYNCRIEGMDAGDLSIRDGMLVKHEDPTRQLVIRLK
jgi:hypothetical protein